MEFTLSSSAVFQSCAKSCLFLMFLAQDWVFFANSICPHSLSPPGGNSLAKCLFCFSKTSPMCLLPTKVTLCKLDTAMTMLKCTANQRHFHSVQNSIQYKSEDQRHSESLMQYWNPIYTNNKNICMTWKLKHMTKNRVHIQQSCMFPAIFRKCTVSHRQSPPATVCGFRLPSPTRRNLIMYWITSF